MPNGKIKLLIVDDEPSIRLTLSRVFIQLGMDVRVAGNGIIALTQIREEIPDVLITDLSMPVMSGFELILLTRNRFPSIRIIAMSGAYTSQCLPPGLTSAMFYQKGSDLSALLRLVESVAHPVMQQNGTANAESVQQQAQ